MGTAVRKPLHVLKPYLDSLDWQEKPKGTEFSYAFVPDFAPDQRDAEDYLLRWVNQRGGNLIAGVRQQQPDFSDSPQFDSHQWGQSAMARVGHNKNLLIQFTLNAKADAIWFCDADLIVDRTTFSSLDATEKPIATGVFWTRWSKAKSETRPIYSGPQVWLRNPYSLDGRGMDESEFRRKLLSRSLTRVYGFGANTLIQRRVLEAGINFDYLPDFPQTGLNAGEDRHFCVRAERAHIDAWADNWPDVFHIYHGDEDVPRIPEMVARLGAPHPVRARLGDLVSLRLRPLEPIQHGPGQFQYSPPIHARGRLGQLQLLPEVEEAVYSTDRGQRQIVRAHFPISHPLGGLRGRTRLIEVYVVDVKSFGFPPVVEQELFVGKNSGAWTDPQTLTEHQAAAS